MVKLRNTSCGDVLRREFPGGHGHHAADPPRFIWLDRIETPFIFADFLAC